VLTYEQALDPLNVFYRRDVKRATMAKEAAKAQKHLQVLGMKDELLVVT